METHTTTVHQLHYTATPPPPTRTLAGGGGQRGFKRSFVGAVQEERASTRDAGTMHMDQGMFSAGDLSGACVRVCVRTCACACNTPSSVPLLPDHYAALAVHRCTDNTSL